MPFGPQLPVCQFGDSWRPNPERLDVAILLRVGSLRRCFQRLDLTCSFWYLAWSWQIDSSWSTDPAASAQRLYIGPPGTVISLLRTLTPSTPVPRSVVPVWPTCPSRTTLNWSSDDACVTPVCRSAAEMWHFLSWSKVHGRV